MVEAASTTAQPANLIFSWSFCVDPQVPSYYHYLMDLFVIQRYTGEDEGAEKDVQGQESAILERLNARALVLKKTPRADKTKDSGKTDEKTTEKTKRKRSKEDKLDLGAVSQHESHFEGKNSRGEKHEKVHRDMKKLKRKKSKEANENDPQEGIVEEKPQKKRKKDKKGKERTENEKALTNEDSAVEVEDERDSKKISESKSSFTAECEDKNNNEQGEDDSQDSGALEKRKKKEKKKNRKNEKEVPTEGSEMKEKDSHEEDLDEAEITAETVIEEDVSESKDQNDETVEGFTIIGGQNKHKTTKKVNRILPEWIADPTGVDLSPEQDMTLVEDLKCLDSVLIDTLKQRDIHSFFPVQRDTIPLILDQLDKHSLLGAGGFRPSDVCVTAPTGSGKTLVYVLPVVQILMHSLVRRLQALVLLPTKDLALQVKQVFDTYTAGTRLKVGLAAGQKSLAKEKEILVGESICGSASRVDILVATPGRLVDHLTSTKHFTLQHLRFLVIDEADRILDESYHGWLEKVLSAAYQSDQACDRSLGGDFVTIRKPPGPLTATSFSEIQLPLQKILISATLTHNPEKLAPLQLYRPKLFSAHSQTTHADTSEGEGRTDLDSLARYITPAGLTEYMTICNTGEKPLMVLYFLKELGFRRVLCFTSSVESTHRLYLLIKLFGCTEVAEFSSKLSAVQRRAILRDFQQEKLQMLICSDAMARGMDVVNVQYVFSYDTPNNIKTYIHRVGRTARANQKGTAFTLLYSEEAYHFKEMMKKTSKGKIPKYNVKEKDLQPMVEPFQDALKKLEETLKEEKHSKKTGAQRDVSRS